MKKQEYKYIFNLIKPYLLKEVIWLLINITMIGLSLLNPFIVKRIIDVSIGNRDIKSLYMNIAFFVIVLLLSQILITLQTYVATYIGERLLYDLRVGLYQNISHKNMLFFDSRQTGDIMNRILSELPSIVSLMAGTTITVITQIATFLFTLVVMLSLSIPITLLVVGVLPFLWLTIVKYNPKFKEIDTRIMEQFSQISNILQENISNIKVFKYFNTYKFGEIRFSSALHKGIKLRYKFTRLSTKNNNIQTVIYNFPRVVIYLVGGYLAIQGKMSVGGMVAISAYIEQLFSPVRTLSNVSTELQKSIAAFNRYYEITTQSNANEIGSFTLEKIKENIEMKNVSFSYPEKPSMVENLQLTIPVGRMIWLRGDNGTGKSTLGDLLCGILKPQQGYITYDRVKVQDIKIASLKRLISVVSQNTYLFHDTVRNNITLGRRMGDESILQLSRQLKYTDVVLSNQVNLDTVISNGGNNLSGGQRQRIAILRALVGNPQVLILDEVSTFLDNQAKSNLYEYVKNNRDDKIIIIISHEDISFLHCDMVLDLDMEEVAGSRIS